MTFLRLSPVARRRWLRFKSIRRGYFSLLVLLGLIALSFGAEFLMNSRALVVVYQDHFYFPTFHFYPGTQFGETYDSEARYRELKTKWTTSGAGADILPPLPFNPYEYDFTDAGNPPQRPSLTHPLGTDNRGRDVLVRLFYGFRVSIVFALCLAGTGYAVGILLGALMGFFGGWVDLGMQRFIEIWSTLPFLYLCIIIASVITPNFLSLLVILALFSWIGMTYYIRTEIYREKAKDYCYAARSIGCSNARIMLKHLLPNCLVPVISFFPFSVVAGINSLTALDFLGYGLPAPTPSWGELLSQGLDHLSAYWITGATFAAIVGTLLLITFIGEAVREAFDPKQYAKYQ